MGYIIGVDGGGTGCRVAVADSAGNVLARAEGGAANIATNFETARTNILRTISLAFVNAEVSKPETANTTAVLGLAGANLGDYSSRLLASLPFSRSHIVSDAETTLVGAIGEADGIIGAIGTGSVYGRREHGEFIQLGGWGFLLGDDGSGARLGRDMLHLAIQAFDGLTAHSPLTLDIIEEYKGSPLNIVEQAQVFTPRDFGQLAPRIVAAAKAGDANAEALLAQHTEVVRKSLDAVGFDPSKAFCMLGGLGNVYLKRLPKRYQQAASTPRGNALDGAVSLAFSLSRAV
ncbi:MAG: N-acetylglucosamine kinase [Rhodobacteraceae bacterium]|nr:N-acetylglucosamine kinase [Paracoccaceae bacterium]